MTNKKLKNILKDIIDTSDVPRGKNIFYECKICNDILPSQPKDNVACSCDNIYIDVDYIRLVVKDLNKFLVKIYEGN